MQDFKTKSSYKLRSVFPFIFDIQVDKVFLKKCLFFIFNNSETIFDIFMKLGGCRDTSFMKKLIFSCSQWPNHRVYAVYIRIPSTTVLLLLSIILFNVIITHYIIYSFRLQMSLHQQARGKLFMGPRAKSN